MSQKTQEPFAWAVEISGTDKIFSSQKAAENARRRYEKVFDAERMEPFPIYRHPAPLSPDHSGGAGEVLPEGWKMVPIEPTSSMLEAGKDERMNCFTNPNLSVEGALIRIYSAIIEASPGCLDKVKELNQ